MLPNIKRIAQKELTLFFASPLAYIFLASFVGICLFAVFWGASFFSRNIADVRPLFEWMPIILIFLCAALTMRMWSEEKRTGTLEFVMTVPSPTWHFVLGKFIACMVLLVTALLLTLVLPVSISFIANLDWGPVISGYLATLLLGSAYIAIGLFMSARSDNQIVSLMLTCLLGGVFYFLGSSLLVNLFSYSTADILRLIGTGSRFDSITRGVIDMRDLYYYLSLTALFIVLNIYSLEKLRWAEHGDRQAHRSWRGLTWLAALNLIAVNIWLSPVTAFRIDTTAGNMYSISGATKSYLEQLQEPLLIRGYFSAKTHPLLSPLVPQIRDLLKEYEIAGKGNVRTEFIDPALNPELEEEANSKYAINPTPFQVADRYQSALVNSYFDLVIQYGDEFEKLGFRDLIEVKAGNETNVDVKLRNPEYDITRSIKKVLYSYQSGGNLFDSLSKPITFTGYFSAPQKLPGELGQLQIEIRQELDKLTNQSGGNFTSNIVDPEADGGAIARDIAEQYGFRPMAASLFSSNTFYFYMILSDGDQVIQIPLPEELNANQFNQSLTAALKRFATGFMKTIGLVAPEANNNPYTGGGGGKQFTALNRALSESYVVQTVDLADGVVPSAIDLLAIMSPDQFTDKQLFAVDQYLMQGGTVILATAPNAVSFRGNMLAGAAHTSGLESWLQHHGITIEKSWVMDLQNSAFPVPVQRRVGPVSIQEVQMLDYPYFPDIRDSGLNRDTPVTADIPQLTMAWASPISLDEEKNQGRTVLELIRSSDQSWTSTSNNLLPRASGGFVPGSNRSSQLLAAAVSGQFDSFYADKESPLLASEPEEENTDNEADDAEPTNIISSVIAKSSAAARIIVFSSNEFLADQTLRMASMADGTLNNAPMQLIINSAEWSLEDSGLLSIRSRGHFSRTLPPLERRGQIAIETINYFLALFGVFAVYLFQRWRRLTRNTAYKSLLAEGA